MEYQIWLTDGGAAAHAKGRAICGDHLNITSLTTTMETYGWVKAGTITSDDLQLPTPANAAQAAVGRLQKDLEEARGKFQMLETEVQGEIQKLLALGYTPQEPDPGPTPQVEDVTFVEQTPEWEVLRNEGGFKCVKTGCELRFDHDVAFGPDAYEVWGDLFYSSSREEYLFHGGHAPALTESEESSREYCLTATSDGIKVAAANCYIIPFLEASLSPSLKSFLLQWAPNIPQI